MKKSILFIHNASTRFVQIDNNILCERYRVNERLMKKKSIGIYPQLISDIKNNDFVFCWFASWHSFFPTLIAKILKKPVICFSGGYDTAKLPEINYGHQNNYLKSFVTKFILENSRAIITSSNFTKDELIRNIGVNPNKISVIYLGIPDPWKEGIKFNKEQIVITVGNVNKSNLTRKGHDLFVRVSNLISNYKFILIGKWQDQSINLLRPLSNGNTFFTGWINENDLNNYFLRSKVYVQLSRHEAFGLSVAEAMLAGCIPFTSNYGSLPEVIGDNGFIAQSLEPEYIAENLLTMLSNYSEGKSYLAREWIINNFPIYKRSQKIFELMDAFHE